MSRFFRFVLLALFAFAAIVPAPPAHAADAPSIAQFLKIRTPGLPDLLPDGSLLQRDWPDGVFQLYRTTPKVAGANASYAPGEVTRTQLTNFPDGVAGFSLSPDGKRCLVLHARGGNENTQISLIDPMTNGTWMSAVIPIRIRRKRFTRGLFPRARWAAFAGGVLGRLTIGRVRSEYPR